VHTVKAEQIEGVFNGAPLNFDPLKQMPPSQELEPIKLFTSSIMGWDVNKFKENMRKSGSAVYGGDGSIGYYTVSGLGVVDIDHEKDFHLATALLEMDRVKIERSYYEI
jgi:CMP-N-acetylneuraminic acid synthetase